MSSATYAFEFNGEGDWKVSSPDDWDLSLIELDGLEKVQGHHKIDGAICKVLKTTDGKLVAITKQS